MDWFTTKVPIPTDVKKGEIFLPVVEMDGEKTTLTRKAKKNGPDWQRIKWSTLEFMKSVEDDEEDEKLIEEFATTVKVAAKKKKKNKKARAKRKTRKKKKKREREIMQEDDKKAEHAAALAAAPPPAAQIFSPQETDHPRRPTSQFKRRMEEISQTGIAKNNKELEDWLNWAVEQDKGGNRRKTQQRGGRTSKRKTRNLRGGDWETANGEANGALNWINRPPNGWIPADIPQGRLQLRTNAGITYQNGMLIIPGGQGDINHNTNPYFINVGWSGLFTFEFNDLNEIAAYVVWIPTLDSNDEENTVGGARRKYRKSRKKRRKSRKKRRRKRRPSRRTRKKRGGKQCPPPGKDWYVKVACGSPKYIACCPSKNYNCEIKPINGRPEPTCVKNERSGQILSYEELEVRFDDRAAALKERGGMASENISS
jgi:hypothetical protein